MPGRERLRRKEKFTIGKNKAIKDRISTLRREIRKQERGLTPKQEVITGATIIAPGISDAIGGILVYRGTKRYYNGRKKKKKS